MQFAAINTYKFLLNLDKIITKDDKICFGSISSDAKYVGMSSVVATRNVTLLLRKINLGPSQPAFICSKFTIETQKLGVKYV